MLLERAQMNTARWWTAVCRD